MRQKSVFGRAPLLLLFGLIHFLLFSFSKSASAETILIGQSLSFGPVADRRGLEVLGGARAYIERINAAGGLSGKRLELVSLEDNGDPSAHEKNVRELVSQRKVAALFGCVGDTACEISASVAKEYRIPLIAPLSGSESLSHVANPYVFSVRASYRKEAKALAVQLREVGCLNVGVVSDLLNERVKLFLASAKAEGLTTKTYLYDTKGGMGPAQLVEQLKGGNHRAVLMDLPALTLDGLTDSGFNLNDAWPGVIVTMTAGNISALMTGFKRQVVGFTTIVPNPGSSKMVLTRQLQQDAEKFAGSHAATFDGMEAYIGIRLLVEGIRRIPDGKVNPANLLRSLETNSPFDIEGFRLSFEPQKYSGSDWVDIGFRSKQGIILN